MIEQVGHLVPNVVLRRYLLGDLNAALRGVLERLCFLSDDLHKRLEIVEVELVDDYVYGRLSAPQRLRFENAYLTSARRRDNIAIAESLRDYSADIERQPGAQVVQERPAWWQSRRSFVVAWLSLVAVVAVGAWVFQMWRRPTVFTIVLAPELSSGSRSPTDTNSPFSVPPAAQRVMFEIHPREPRRQGYSAVLKLNRTVVETAREIKISNTGVLPFDVPITKLKTGTYSLELTATDGASSAGPVDEFRFELLIRP